MEYKDALYILGMPPLHSSVDQPTERAGSGYRSKSASRMTCALRAFRSIPHAHTLLLTIMKAVLQRVSEASVKIDGIVKGEINRGLLILLGIAHEDTLEDVEWLGKKIIQLRIFGDADDKMNLSVQDIGGQVLLVSQFTLHASTKKGNRPAFTQAAPPVIAVPLYEAMIKWMEQELPGRVQTGTFGADMKVSLLNDGPVTILLDTQNKV